MLTQGMQVVGSAVVTVEPAGHPDRHWPLESTPVEQAVHVVVAPKQVLQLPEHATHSPADDVVVVKPVGQAKIQLPALSTFPTAQEVQVSIFPEQVKQLILQTSHTPETSTVVSLGHCPIH